MVGDRRQASPPKGSGVKAALLRFAPVYDPRMVDDSELGRDLMVQRGALKEPLKLGEKIPVVVDHDDSRQVGTVREIFIAPDVNGGVVQDWYFASVELTEPAPGWLKRNGGVSWSHYALRTQEIGETTRLLRGLIKEISILTPSTQPAEAFARVVWFGDPVTKRSVPAGDVIVHPPGGVLVRRNIGRVLAVGGRPLARTRSGQAIRREGRDYVVDHDDGSATIYSREGYVEALRGGTLGVR